MKPKLKIFGFIFLLMIAACKPSVNVTSIHLIRVDAYESQAENVALAADLFSYDPAYVMSHINSYDPVEMAGAINLGYHIPTDQETNPTYRYIFKMGNKSVRKNSDALKADFDAYIPKLMDTHVSKKNVYEDLTAPAEDWLNLLLDGKIEAAYDQSGSKIKDSASLDQFIEGVTDLKSQFGEIQSSRFYAGSFMKIMEVRQNW